MLFAWLAYRQVGHWPVYSRPDPSDVGVFHPRDGIGHALLILIVWLAIPASLIAFAATIVNTARSVVKSNWTSNIPLRLLLCLVGMALFWSQLFRLKEWLQD